MGYSCRDGHGGDDAVRDVVVEEGHLLVLVRNRCCDGSGMRREEAEAGRRDGGPHGGDDALGRKP